MPKCGMGEMKWEQKSDTKVSRGETSKQSRRILGHSGTQVGHSGPWVPGSKHPTNFLDQSGPIEVRQQQGQFHQVWFPLTKAKRAAGLWSNQFHYHYHTPKCCSGGDVSPDHCKQIMGTSSTKLSPNLVRRTFECRRRPMEKCLIERSSERCGK